MCIYIYIYYIYSNFKVMNLRKGVGIDHCNKNVRKEDTKIMYLPAVANLSNS